MNQTLKIIADIIGEPSTAFRVLKNKPNWRAVCIIIALVSIGIAWAVLPFSKQIAHAKMLESDLDASQIEQTRTMVDVGMFVGILLMPILLLIKWLIFAGFLYFGAQLLGSAKALKFKPTFAVVVHAELIFVFSKLINTALLLCFKEIDNVKNAIDLQMIPGLHFLFTDHALGVPVLTLLSRITPFSIWYLIVLSLGVAVVADIKTRKVAWLVVCTWLVNIGVQIAISAL